MKFSHISSILVGIAALVLLFLVEPEALELEFLPESSPSPQVLAEIDDDSTSPSAIDRETVQFSRVIDGDTIEVSTDGAKMTVRIIGINTPETVDPRKSVECFGQEASAFAREYFQPQAILLLEADSSQTNVDRYGRRLRYVFVNGEDYGGVAIAKGYATEYTYNSAYRYQALYRQLEQQAREVRVGLWANDVCGGSM